MPEGMQYDLVQGQGHEPFKVGNSFFSSAIFPPFTMGASN